MCIGIKIIKYLTLNILFVNLLKKISYFSTNLSIMNSECFVFLINHLFGELNQFEFRHITSTVNEDSTHIHKKIKYSLSSTNFKSYLNKLCLNKMPNVQNNNLSNKFNSSLNTVNEDISLCDEDGFFFYISQQSKF